MITNIREAERFSVLLSLSIYTSLYLLALCFSSSSLDVDPNWLDQLPYLLIFLGICSTIQLFLNRTIYRFWFYILHSLALGILTVGLHGSMSVRLILMVSSLLQAGMLFPITLGILLSCLSIGIAILHINGFLAWGIIVVPMKADEILILVLSGGILALLVILVRQTLQSNSLLNLRNRSLTMTINELTEAVTDFQAHMSVVESQSASRERNRISRDIHDSVGYTLTNIKMMMEAAMRVAFSDKDKLFRLLHQTREQADHGLSETRAAMHQLRKLKDAPLHGIHAINYIARIFQTATGVRVRVDQSNVSWLYSQDVNLAVYRIIQEGMTNSFKHGKATDIFIYLFESEKRNLHVLLRDNGTGTHEIKEGIGFSGMKERVQRLNGTVAAHNVSGGFEVSAIIPVER